jgi:dual specificity phosphatase 12
MASISAILKTAARQWPSNPPIPAEIFSYTDQGVSRSPTIVIAYLMRTQRKGRDEVLEAVRSRRARVKPNANFMRQLDVWEETGYQIWEDGEERAVPKREYKEFLDQRAGGAQG